MATVALPAHYSLQVHLETLSAVVAILVTCIGGAPGTQMLERRAWI